jgi:hypothetical protein
MENKRLRQRTGTVAVGAIAIIVVLMIVLTCIGIVVMESNQYNTSVKNANEAVATKAKESLVVERVSADQINVTNEGSTPAVIVGLLARNRPGEGESVRYFNISDIIPLLGSKQINLPDGVPPNWPVGVVTSLGNIFWEEQPVQGGTTQTVPPGQPVYVTFTAQGLGSDASGTVLTVDGSPYTYSQLPKTFQWVSGSTHSFSWSSLVSGSSGARYVWASTSGLSTKQSDNSFTVNANGYVIATYKTQYSLTMNVNPLGGGTTNPALGTYWYDSGSTVQILATASSGYVFSNWAGSGLGSYSGTANPSSVTVNGPITETANFAPLTATVTFTVSGLSSDASGTVLTVDSVGYSYSQLPKSFTWNIGSNHTFGWMDPVSSTVSGKQYVWVSTSGPSTAKSGSIIVPSGGGSVSATYKTQYYLTMQANPTYGGTVSPGSGWRDAGTQVQISATPASGYAFASWTGSGSGSYTGTANPATTTMNGPVTETANFIPWLTGWSYRRPITISSTLSLSNYQILVQVDTASLISAGKMRSDGGDIRFTDSDGATLLSYWIEPGTVNTASTKIWVKVPSIPAGTKTIYMYYGNPSATSQSNSVAVFGKRISSRFTTGDCDAYYDAFILSSKEWISGGTYLGISGDDSYGSRTMPYTITIYGTSVSTITLSTNGLLRWDGAGDSRYSNYLDMSSKILTAHWDDLYISTSYRSDAGIYEIMGTDANLGQYVAYRWATTYYGSPSTPADFETILYRNGYIQFNVYRLWSSATPTECICRGDGSNYIDLTSRWSYMESILFVPRAVPEPTVSLGFEQAP